MHDSTEEVRPHFIDMETKGEVSRPKHLIQSRFFSDVLSYKLTLLIQPRGQRIPWGGSLQQMVGFHLGTCLVSGAWKIHLNLLDCSRAYSSQTSLTLVAMSSSAPTNALALPSGPQAASEMEGEVLLTRWRGKSFSQAPAQHPPPRSPPFQGWTFLGKPNQT